MGCNLLRIRCHSIMIQRKECESQLTLLDIHTWLSLLSKNSHKAAHSRSQNRIKIISEGWFIKLIVTYKLKQRDINSILKNTERHKTTGSCITSYPRTSRFAELKTTCSVGLHNTIPGCSVHVGGMQWFFRRQALPEGRVVVHLSIHFSISSLLHPLINSTNT